MSSTGQCQYCGSTVSSGDQKCPNCGAPNPNYVAATARTVFLLRLGGAAPGDLVSMYLGAAGLPPLSYLAGGILGSLPRVAAATVLGASLWAFGTPRFWLSLLPGAVLTVCSLLLWRIWKQ